MNSDVCPRATIAPSERPLKKRFSHISTPGAGWRVGSFATSTTQKTSCRKRCCAPFGIFGRLRAETDARGFSESSAIAAMAGAARRTGRHGSVRRTAAQHVAAAERS